MLKEASQSQKRPLIVTKPQLWGIGAGTVLLAVYFAILSVANSFSHALTQFQELWYWISLLVVGFGVQVGLYAHIRTSIKMRTEAGAATSSVAAAGGVSTTSMVACCAHHLTDVLPILGVSAAAVFLNQYQSVFIVVGVLSNLIGINLMLRIIQEHSLYREEGGMLSSLMRFNMKKMLYATIIFSVTVFSLALFNAM